MNFYCQINALMHVYIPSHSQTHIFFPLVICVECECAVFRFSPSLHLHIAPCRRAKCARSAIDSWLDCVSACSCDTISLQQTVKSGNPRLFLKHPVPVLCGVLSKKRKEDYTLHTKHDLITIVYFQLGSCRVIIQ